MTGESAVDTKSADRRPLSFATLDEAVAEAERLATGEVRLAGNQTFPQLIDHLARSIDANLNGFKAKLPLLLRPLAFVARTVFGEMLRKRMTTTAMPAGVNLPKVLRPEFDGSPDVPLDEALQHYRESASRLQTADSLPPHPIFGKLTPQESEQFHCRHAELHLSFVHPV